MNEPHTRAKKVFAIKPLAACLAAVLATGGMIATSHTFAAAATPSAAIQAGHHFGIQYKHNSARHNRHQPHPSDRSTRAQPNRPAGIVPVTSCADDGSAGTLRDAATNAVSGDTLDLSALGCSTITLTQGAIATSVDDLTVQGPSTGTVTVDGSNNEGVFYHTGAGTLSIDHLTITNGYGYYIGGGVFSAGNLTLSNSTVTANTAYYQGAGLCTNGDLTIVSSEVSGNTAISDTSYGLGGGVLGGTSLTIKNSTISDNNANVGAGAYSFGPTIVSNSTISGNSAVALGGGLMSQYPITLHGSTVAFNTATNGGSGLFVTGSSGPDLQSSVVANNSASSPGYAIDLASSQHVTVTGSHNLIVSSDAVVPGDTRTEDPVLQPLANNGGPTKTHALGAGSPAIDTGSNPDNLGFDQRGSGFARVSGAAADIGAFEVQADIIFQNGFDS